MSSLSVPASLESLPLDTFTNNLVSFLSYSSLVNLGSTSRSLHASLSGQLIWRAFLYHKQYVDITQLKPLSALPLRLRAAIGGRADTGWENHTFKSRSLFPRRWQRICLPRLEISSEFIVVGVGADLNVRWIRDIGLFDKTQEEQWMAYQLGAHGSEDITEILPLPELPTEFIVGQANGLIRHLELSMGDATYTVKRVFQHPRAIIRSLSMTGDCLVALSSTSSNTHQISFFPLNKSEDTDTPSSSEIYPIHTESPSVTEWLPTMPTKDVVQPDFTTDYPSRPWQALFLSPTVLALGSTSPETLSIYNFHPASSHPLQKSRNLRSHPAKLSGLREFVQCFKTSIYAMHHYAPSLLLTGWYHGPANIHDLRLSSEYPVIEMNDPLDDGAAYSVSTDGGNRVLVGGANHGLVKIFDVRMPSQGWSIYLGRERSPIYAIRGEHSRIFAATEGTVWECDFTYKNKSRTYEISGTKSGPARKSGQRWGLLRQWRTTENATSGAHVRLHCGKEKLYREDGSEIGKASIMGVAL